MKRWRIEVRRPDGRVVVFQDMLFEDEAEVRAWVLDNVKDGTVLRIEKEAGGHGT